jgi:hypothetical protein
MSRLELYSPSTGWPLKNLGCSIRSARKGRICGRFSFHRFVKTYLNRTFRIVLVGVILLSQQQVQPKDSADEALLKRALAPFAGRTIDGIFDYLDRIRPAPVKDSDKQLLLRDMTLITDETMVRDPLQIQRLKERVRATLALHRRLNVVEFFIYRYPYPGAMNRPGVFITLTTTLLQLIGDDDAALIGVVSHELAHEYVATEMTIAQNQKDWSRVQDLELFCDAVAVATLIALGLDTDAFTAILGRIVSFSQESVKLNNGDQGMPSLLVRKRLIATITSSLAASSH